MGMRAIIRWESYLVVAILVGVMLLAVPAVAEEAASSTDKFRPGFRDAPWRFHANVYGWLPAAPVTLKTDEVDVSIPESLDTILDSLDMAAMLELEVHKGRFGAFVSPVYYRAHFSKDIGLIPWRKQNVRLEEDAWLIKYGASYDLGPWHLKDGQTYPMLTLQPYVGALYLHDDITSKVDPFIGIRTKTETTIEFNTPIVGMNTMWDLNERWYLRIGGNYGGWDVDDVDETREFIGTANYRFKMWGVDTEAFAGYRYVHIDFESGATEVHLDIKGPLIGIGWKF